MPPYYDLLLFVYASLPCSISVCQCPLFVFYLLLIGVFLLCFIVAHWCLLPMFCLCLSMLPCYVLLVFVGAFVLCFVGVH
jgi:hypothetical protein